MKYKATPGPITADLDWLRTPVTGNWSSSQVNDEKPLYVFLSSGTASRCGLAMGGNLKTIDDVGIHNGNLFAGSVRQYDVLILGHEEYVTKQEYHQFKQFVASGGRIVAMSGNTFWAEVAYSKSTGIETFVSGHGFAFKGVYDWRSDSKPFDRESMNWFGSAFAHGMPHLRGAIIKGGHVGLAMMSVFHKDLAFTGYSYPHSESNYVGNFTNTQLIAAFYHNSPGSGAPHFRMPDLPVDAYEHKYVKGEVICLCIFGENLVGHDKETQFFLLYSSMRGFDPSPMPHFQPTPPHGPFLDQLTDLYTSVLGQLVKSS